MSLYRTLLEEFLEDVVLYLSQDEGNEELTRLAEDVDDLLASR